MEAWSLLRKTFIKSVDDRVPKLAAALAYYMAFSLVPLLVIAVAVAGHLYGPAAARGEVAGQLSGLVGETAAGVIQATIALPPASAADSLRPAWARWFCSMELASCFTTFRNRWT